MLVIPWAGCRVALFPVLRVRTLVAGKQKDPVECVEKFGLGLAQTLQVFHPERHPIKHDRLVAKSLLVVVVGL